MRICLQLPGHVKTADPWHHQIEQDEIGRFLPDTKEGVVAVLGGYDPESVATQVVADQLKYVGIVIDRQNAGRLWIIRGYSIRGDCESLNLYDSDGKTKLRLSGK
jgi:hypothetical protein